MDSRWELRRALHAIVDWQRGWIEGRDMTDFTLGQIEQYESEPTHD